MAATSPPSMGVLGEAFLNIKGNLKPLESDIAKIGGGVMGKLRALGAAAGTAFSSAFTIGATAGLAALVGGGALGIKLGLLSAAAEESASLFSVVFNYAAEETGRSLDEFAKAAGRSKFELRDFAWSLAALIGPLGFDAQATGEMSVKLTKLTTDLSSFVNVAESDVFVALRSGLLGESEPMRRFGVQISAARVEAEALSLGLIRTKEDLTGAAKASAILSIIMRDTAQAQGDAERTAGSFSNSLRAMKGAWRDLGIQVGRLFLPSMTAVVQSLSSVGDWLQQNTQILEAWGKDVGEIVANVLRHFSGLVVRVRDFFGDTLNATIRTFTGGAANSFSEFVSQALAGLRVLTTDLNATWELAKIGMKLAFTQGVVLALEHLNLLKSVAFGIFSGIRGIAVQAFDGIGAAMAVFGIDFKAIFAGVRAVVEETVDGMLREFKQLGEVLGVLSGGMAELARRAGQALTGRGQGGAVPDAFAIARDKVLAAHQQQREAARSALADLGRGFLDDFAEGFDAAWNANDPLTRMLDRWRAERDAFAAETAAKFRDMAQAGGGAGGELGFSGVKGDLNFGGIGGGIGAGKIDARGLAQSMRDFRRLGQEGVGGLMPAAAPAAPAAEWKGWEAIRKANAERDKEGGGGGRSQQFGLVEFANHILAATLGEGGKKEDPLRKLADTIENGRVKVAVGNLGPMRQGPARAG